MLHQEPQDRISVRQMVTGWLQEVVEVTNAVAQGFGYALLVLLLIFLCSILLLGATWQ